MDTKVRFAPERTNSGSGDAVTNSGSGDASGLDGEEDSVTRLAQQRGFDKCPVCWVLVITDAVVTECAHKFCASCLSTLSAQSFSFTCPSCRTMCLTMKTIPAKKLYREIKQFTCPAPGCPSEVVMTLAEFEKHIRKQCPSRLIKCGCGSLVKGDLYEIHQRSVHPKIQCTECNEDAFTGLVHLCPKDSVACFQCHESFFRQSLPGHILACPHRKIKCTSCGLPGTQIAIHHHQSTCRIELCPFCERRFRADKLLQHACPSTPVACPIANCSFKGHYDILGRHIRSHPELCDTGIFSEIAPTIYVVADEDTPTDVWFARKISDDSTTMLIRFFGDLSFRRDTLISKTSPRLTRLETSRAHYSAASLHRLFSDIGPLNISALFTQGLLTHKEGEIIAQLERQYKCPVNGIFPSLGLFNFPFLSSDPFPLPSSY